jgi:glycosyltransferase involved in cell wall biosynthesis
MPLEYESHYPPIVSLLNFMKSYWSQRESLPEFFHRLEKIKEDPNLPKEDFLFPGPLIRKIVHFLDGIGLAPQHISRYAAISRNVSIRKDYFPNEAKVEIIYPPSHLSRLRSGKMEYLFTASRLDGPKRIGLFIEVMKHVKSPVEFMIAGTGPEENQLKELSHGDPRIHFLGFVNDAELIDLYADALAILYAPYDEDYGFITIEAMMSGKPVITTHDSGGPNEFVRNGETGFSVPSDPKAIAKSIDYLCEHRDQAYSMGLKAKGLVEDITWEETISQLLGFKEGIQRAKLRKRRKISVTSTFPIFPPRGGGQSRIFHLYRHLAKKFVVELVTMTHFGEPHFRGEIAPNLWENRIPKTEEHQKEEWALERKLGGVPITDVAMPRLFHSTPEYMEALNESLRSADFVVASHPYLLPAIQNVGNKTIWYEAHNVEADLKQSILPDNQVGQELLEITKRVESECCRLSKIIMVCSQEDGERLSQIYGADVAKIIEVPNGVDLETVNYVSPKDRLEIKRRLGMENSFNALFMGSWHGPNLEAVRSIFEMAKELRGINFIIIGSACLAFQNEKIPSNVGLMGTVDDETKNVILGLVDVAINPMESGSGTNLKMLDYCAAGIPVISTLHGIRGLRLNHEIDIASVDQFPNAILKARKNWNEIGARIEEAKDKVITHYDWAIIAENFIKEISKRGMLLP